MKTCAKCKIEKKENEFFFRNKLKKILHGYCKDCKRDIDRKDYAKDKNNRRTKIRKNSLDQVLRAKLFIQRVKKLSECKKCSESRWYVLDFHHLRDKKMTIAELSHRGPSIKTLKEEIRKCIVLCSNCHREEHYLNGDVAHR